MWTYNNEEFTSEMIDEYVGFVYCITNSTNEKKYIGKKTFQSRRTLPPLKGKTRKRKVVKESDWMTYYGSSEEVKTLVEEHGGEVFNREILHLCRTKGEMGYLEAYQQFKNHVLLDDSFYNGIVNCKIHRSHVSNLKKEDLE